ncbi:hypothetical protein TNCV_2644951 [Trichonephila clavipes]|nr:hypothetical protein TNCV_2644951 [Trichonephila clavipes]
MGSEYTKSMFTSVETKMRGNPAYKDLIYPSQCVQVKGGYHSTRITAMSVRIQANCCLLKIERYIKIMAKSGSSFAPTSLGREDNVEVRQPPQALALQWCLSRFNFPDPEVGGAAGFRVLPEVYFSRSKNVEDFLEE